MFDIVLYEPEIAPNTGNIMRLCANTGCRLHLIEPLGFDLEERKLRRAGLDYREFTAVLCYADYPTWQRQSSGQRVWACTTKGHTAPSAVAFQPGDALLFGPESRGLPRSVLDDVNQNAWLRLPMWPNSRSLNLSNAVAVVVYEAWRQQDYAGAVDMRG